VTTRGSAGRAAGSPTHNGERDLVWRERVALTLLIGLLFMSGLWPRSVLATPHGESPLPAAAQIRPA
jgi:hypothetical protein